MKGNARMKSFLRLVVLLYLVQTPAQAQEDAWTYTNDELTQGQQIIPEYEDVREALMPPTASAEDNDPLEDINMTTVFVTASKEFAMRMYVALCDEFGNHFFIQERATDFAIKTVDVFLVRDATLYARAFNKGASK